MSDAYDPWERATEEEQNDWAVRSHLYAQRRLAELDEAKTREKVRRMLADVVPGPRVCGHISGKDEGRRRCGRMGARMIALTGDWVCGQHDPLGACGARRGAWACSIPVADHGCDCHTGGVLPHRFTRLEG